MPCLLVILMVSFPRLVLVCMWLLTTILQRAYHGMLIPLLGFFFLPITTIAYAWMATHDMPLEGVNIFILIVAVLLDAGSHGGAGYSRRIQRR
jgi:hypothetical protein